MSTPPRPYASLTLGPSCLNFYLGDCLDVLAGLPAAAADVIVTSPPYNLGIAYRSYDDTLPRPDYLAWTSSWVSSAARLLQPEGSLFLNVGAKPTEPWTALDIAQQVRPHLQLQNTIHWVKSISVERPSRKDRAGEVVTAGHYKPISSQRFVHDCHEFIFHFSHDGRRPLDRLAVGVRYQDQSNVTRWRSASAGIRCRGNTWFIPYDTIQSRDKERPHPATFPPRLPEMCIRLHGRSRTTVVADPFLGLGSTAVACARLGVSFIGVEMDEHYLREAINRTRSAHEHA